MNLHDLTNPFARVLARTAASAVFSHEERAAILAGAAALEREARRAAAAELERGKTLPEVFTEDEDGA